MEDSTIGEYAATHGKRVGAFIIDAVTRYLRDADRPSELYDVCVTLYSMSDDALKQVCDKYAAICAAGAMGVK